jgi:hypothetical protein
MHGPIYKAAAKFIFSHVVKALKEYWTKKSGTKEIVDTLAQTFIEKAKIDADVQTLLINGLIKANDNLASLQSRLIDTVPVMADATRNHGKQLVAPVGASCRSIGQFRRTPAEFTIEEADAEVIRGDSKMEVDDMAQFKCIAITEINIGTGHCIVQVDGFDGPLPGKINDPSISVPGNVYTRSLDSQAPFQITAKPVKRDGVVKRLYISDAREIGRP